VADAYVRTHVRFAQIADNERSVLSGMAAFAEDVSRTRNQQGLPLETLDSLRQLSRARREGRR